MTAGPCSRSADRSARRPRASPCLSHSTGSSAASRQGSSLGLPRHHLQQKAGSCKSPRRHRLYSAIGVRYSSAGRRRSCSPARTAYAPNTSFYQSSGISREICLQHKSAAPMEDATPEKERILWLILYCVSLYYTGLLSAMDCRICSRLLSARPCR